MFQATNCSNNSTLGGTITNWYGFRAINNTTATNNYSFHSTQALGATRWCLYMTGTAQNYINGNLGLGVTVPTARLHIAAGSTTITPLLLTSGTVNTTAVAGAIEYNNTFFMTQSDAVRRSVVLAVNATKTAGSPVTDGFITIRIGSTDVKILTTA